MKGRYAYKMVNVAIQRPVFPARAQIDPAARKSSERLFIAPIAAPAVLLEEAK